MKNNFILTSLIFVIILCSSIYVSASCSGTLDCTQFSSSSNPSCQRLQTYNYCTWNSATSSCSGYVPNSCSFFNADQIGCNNYGCTWTADASSTTTTSSQTSTTNTGSGYYCAGDIDCSQFDLTTPNPNSGLTCANLVVPNVPNNYCSIVGKSSGSCAGYDMYGCTDIGCTWDPDSTTCIGNEACASGTSNSNSCAFYSNSDTNCENTPGCSWLPIPIIPPVVQSSPNVCCVIIYSTGFGNQMTFKYMVSSSDCNNANMTISKLNSLYQSSNPLPCNNNNCRITYEYAPTITASAYYSIAYSADPTMNCDYCAPETANCNLDSSDKCEVNLMTDNAHCGNCDTACDSQQSCISGKCVNNCGNGIINPGEDCDIKINNTDCSSYGVGSSCTFCNPFCKLETKPSDYCGDGIINGPAGFEQCDNGTALNGQACNAYDVTAGCAYCDNNCKNVSLGKQFCGDHICQAGYETISTCFKDCSSDYGWHTDDDTWSLTSDNYLMTNESSGIIYSDYLDINANTTYILSAIVNNSGRDIVISLDGTCLDESMQQGNCFTIDSSKDIIVSNPSTNLYSVTFNITSNKHSTNGIYFKNVRLMINSTPQQGFTNSYAIINNISLKEYTTTIYSNLHDPLPLDGCCPASYCWDGIQCRNSDEWMNHSDKAPLWSSMSDNSIFGHINTSDQTIARGYRCIIVNYSSHEAQWVLSDVKYDWNYKNSGYCARSTDCFVGAGYSNTNSNYSTGCVLDGDIISDKNILNEGNHYCHQGSWTTKSYIVATTLQNISATQGNNYILQCYDNYSLNYNPSITILPDYYNYILSSCVMIMQIPNGEQIITGVVLNSTVLSQPDYTQAFLDSIVQEYSSDNNDEVVIPYSCINNPTLLSGSNFSACVDAQNAKRLYVYYETNYKYFIISDKTIPGISTPTFWDVIVSFFQKLFSNKNVGHIQPYDVINYSTNYDNIYIMRNGTVNVTAIEESKYDELNQSMVNIMYIRYSGSNDTNNPISRDEIFNNVNDTMRLLQQNAIPVMLNYTNSSSEQEIILRTQNRSGLWPYMTTILRIRP